jgi:hypothetical protein
VHDLPNELLDRVFLGVASSLHLVRAAATCRRWRRAVADRGFLGRFGALHSATRVAGHYYATEKSPPTADATADPTGRPLAVETKLVMLVPTPAAALSVVDSKLFSLNFLFIKITPKVGVVVPRKYQWACRSKDIVDSRGSLLLLRTAATRFSPDFIVCEPVTRRFQAIAGPAGFRHLLFLGAFLLDGGGGANSMSGFRVLTVLCERNTTYSDRGTPRALVFAPGGDDGGGWQLGWHEKIAII